MLESPKHKYKCLYFGITLIQYLSCWNTIDSTEIGPLISPADNYLIKVTPVSFPAQSKLNQPSGCAGMCGICVIIFCSEEPWMIVAINCSDALLLHLLWSGFEPARIGWFRQMFFLQRREKNLFPLPLYTQCHPELLMPTHTGRLTLTHTANMVKDMWDLWETLSRADGLSKTNPAPGLKESYQKEQLDWLWQGTDGIERLYRKPCHQQFCAFR